MTENEAINIIFAQAECETKEHICDKDKCDECELLYMQGTVKEHREALQMAINSLSEIQQYRAIGTVEELIKEHKELIELSRKYLIDTNELLEYQAIGTAEQLKAIKQWKSDVMEGFCKYDASSFEEIVVNARAEAIEEFAEALIQRLKDCIDEFRLFEGEDIFEVAEQVKGGAV
jgi:hypothetical protein